MLPHQELFQRLQDVAEIRRLIGRTEDLHLDCKLWPQDDVAAQKMLAKALCGFANAEGGVIVFGLDARSGQTKYDPDVIQKAVPVADALYVKSRVEGLIGDLVEPRLQGVLVTALADNQGSKEGFVVINVPPTDGSPCRSIKGRDFYQRIASGTYPMEYFQIADMFGRRHRPSLSLYVKEGAIRGESMGAMVPCREFIIGIENSGRALAKFPSMRFKTSGARLDNFGIDGNGRVGLPQLPTDYEYTVFAGGADHVIHPGTVLQVTKVLQSPNTHPQQAAGAARQRLLFVEFTFTAELAAEECPAIQQSRKFEEKAV
jgi:hypothetical protein